jgi:hypothetical protein
MLANDENIPIVFKTNINELLTIKKIDCAFVLLVISFHS